MEKVTHGRIIGIDVSRDWLEIHCLPDGHRHRIPNNDDGHGAVSDLAHDQRAVVCFEATGGQEWRLWFHLEDAGVETAKCRQPKSRPSRAAWEPAPRPTGSMPNL